MKQRLSEKGAVRGKVVGRGLATFALVITSGCSGVSGALSGCSDADESVAAGVMEQTETNFQAGPDPENIVSKVEFARAKTIELPQELRRFGAERLLTVVVKIFFDGEEGSGFDGVESGGFFALAADGEVLGPVDITGREFFTVPEPSNPGWSEYADRLADSDPQQALFRCSIP